MIHYKGGGRVAAGYMPMFLIYKELSNQKAGDRKMGKRYGWSATSNVKMVLNTQPDARVHS